MSKINLHFGDCLEILKTLPVDKTIIVTDPPFNVGYHYNSYKDNMKDEEYYTFLNNVFNNRPFVCVHYPETLYKISYYINRFPTKVVSWVYNSNTRKQHRDIAFLMLFQISVKLNNRIKIQTIKGLKKGW